MATAMKFTARCFEMFRDSAEKKALEEKRKLAEASNLQNLKLPDELLARIFAKVAEMMKSEMLNRNYLSIAQNLISVCRRFKKVILSNPTFWRVLRSDMPAPIIKQHLRYVRNCAIQINLKLTFPVGSRERMFLERASNLPNEVFALQISVQDYNIIEAIPKELKKLSKIDVDAVERLTVTYGSKSTYYLSVTGYRRDGIKAFESITDFHFILPTLPSRAYPHVEQAEIRTSDRNILDFLVKAPFLRRLDLSYSPFLLPPSPKKILLLPNLAFLRLNIDNQPETGTWLLGALEMPNIQCIVLQTASHGEQFINIFPEDKHYPFLTTLTLIAKYQGPADYDPLPSIIARFPTIKSLTFGHRIFCLDECLSALRTICRTLRNTKGITRLLSLCACTDIVKEWPELPSDIQEILDTHEVKFRHTHLSLYNGRT